MCLHVSTCVIICVLHWHMGLFVLVCMFFWSFIHVYFVATFAFCDCPFADALLCTLCSVLFLGIEYTSLCMFIHLGAH